MRICLSVSRSGGESYRYELDQDEVLVGRAEGADVRLPDAAVSLVHVRLLRSASGVAVVDAGSTNGSRRGGQRLPAGEAVPLAVGDRLELGPFTLEVVSPGEGAPVTRPEDTAGFARRMVLELLGGEAAHPWLEVASGPQRGERLPVPPVSGPLVVGRGEGCSLCLDDADASRRHLELRREAAGVLARDLGSKNGLLVNDEAGQGPRRLRDGDRLRVGRTELAFHDPAEEFLGSLGVASPPPTPPAPDSPPAPPATSARPPGRGSLLLVVEIGRAHV